MYVPTVIARYTAGEGGLDLYVVSRFFAIKSQAEADAFVTEFEGNQLAEELILMYNTAVLDEDTIESLSQLAPYYTEKEYLEDKAEF